MAAMAAWTIVGLALIRLPWIEHGVVQGLIQFQRTLALWYGATSTSAVLINSSCSGADQIVLCLGVTLAYPVAWTRRLAGAAGGLVVVLVLNTVRIGTLFSTVDSPRVFEILHLYVWPAALMAAVAVYVLGWIRWNDGARSRFSPTLVRFSIWGSALLVAYAAFAPWAFTSPLVLEAGVWAARAGEALLAFTGTANAQGNMLITSRGAFQVTPECLLTPLIPVYLAAAVAWPSRPSRRCLAVLLALPVFFVLGVIRLLVLALPPYILDAPVVVAHGFFQLVLGFLLIGAAARYRPHPERRRVARSWFAGLVGCAAAAAVAAPWWNSLVAVGARSLQVLAPHALPTLRSPGDVQGALVLMPVYQLALLTGVWLAARGSRGAPRYAAALLSLAALQVLTLVAVGECQAHGGVALHALALRAWAVAVPLVLTLVWNVGADRSNEVSRSYREFWHDVGDHFPTLTGAASTAVLSGQRDSSADGAVAKPVRMCAAED